MKNAFNDMEDDNIRSFYGGSSDQKIRTNINKNLGGMRFLGQIADVYVNHLVKTMTKIVGGEANGIDRRGAAKDDLNKSKYPNL